MTIFLLLAAVAAPQDKTAKKSEKKPVKVEPLPEGQVKVLKAIVMEVKGVAQARKTRKDKWQALKINDALDPGTVVRTGRKSHVALRVGMNASLVIERQSRVAIPEIIQKGKVLKTRVQLGFGKADVRVDRIGLDNDFEVATPTATLAVRGTAWRHSWDVTNGHRAVGVPGNKIRAIEVRYLRGVKIYMSGAASTSDEYKLPALDAFYETYLWPLLGAIDPSEYPDLGQDPRFLDNPSRNNDVKAARAQRGLDDQPTGRNAPPQNQEPAPESK
jgi:hypothetical protein